MTTTIQLEDNQNSALRALHFWRRNLLVANRQQVLTEMKKSKIAIFQLFQYCDLLNISNKI